VTPLEASESSETTFPTYALQKDPFVRPGILIDHLRRLIEWGIFTKIPIFTKIM